MTLEADQFTTDFEEVQSALDLYPGINIIQVEGDPPNSYEIEYLLKGVVRNPDGSVGQDSQHRIRINLPFGYPHFPPTVKPLTPLFHPDIDPDAVRVTSQWQKNPSLSELILYIGEMISGNKYNLEEPFNQEAADWYAAHLDELPLDSLEVGGIQADGEGQDEMKGFSTGLDVEETEGDEDGEEYFSLNMEVTEGDKTAEQDYKQQLDLIQLRIEQNAMITAGKLLDDIPESAAFPGREDLEQIISSARRKADQLMDELKRHENDDEFSEALGLVDKIAAVAVDTPGLSDIRHRLQQSQVLADTFSTETPAVENGGSAGAENKKAKKAKKASPDTVKLVGRKKVTRNKASDSHGIHSGGLNLPIISIIGTVVVVVVLGIGGAFYFKDTAAVKRAGTSWQEAQQLVDIQQFDLAEIEARAALGELDSIKLLHSKEKAIRDEVNTLLNSTDFKKGMMGEIKYKGKYQPIEVVKALRELDGLVTAADALLKTGKVRKAIPAYGKARRFAVENKLTAQAEELATTVNNLRIEDSMSSAGRAEEAQEWENAAETYQRALELSQKLADGESGEISKKLAAATFHLELDKSKKSFTDAQWQQTVENLEYARELLEENPGTISPEQRAELDRLLAESRLFHILSLGRLAYENGDLNTAINEYERSLALLDTEKEQFTDTYEHGVARIGKTLLMIRITREQRAATAAEENKDLKTSLRRYKAIKKLIDGTTFTRGSSLLALEKNTNAKIRSQGAVLSKSNNVKWLKRNYNRLFRQAYPSSRTSTLSNPRVTFLRNQNGRQIYRITCSERSHGSSFLLELKYQFNPALNKWSKVSTQ